jgi:hypothetical protein
MKFAHTWLLIATPFLTALLWLLLRWGDRRRTRLREQFAGGGVKTWAKPAANTDNRCARLNPDSVSVICRLHRTQIPA